MLTPIKNDYVYSSAMGTDPSPVGALAGASSGTGTALFTYNTFLGYGVSVWDSYYGPYRSHAVAATLTSSGWTAGNPTDLVTRRIRTPVLAADGDGDFLHLVEAIGPGSSGAVAGYEVLSVSGTEVSEGGLNPTGDFTYNAAPTSVLPGTSTFFAHRAVDLNASPDTYTSSTATIDKVTTASGAASHTTVTSGLSGYLDLRGVVPVDATTAYAVAGPATTNGGSGQFQLRFYKLTTDDGLVDFDDIFFATPMEYTAPYPGTTGSYPVEIFSWGPDPDGPSGPATPGSSGVLRRWGISHDGTQFSLEQMALDQIDIHAQPPDASGTNFVTQLYGAQYVSADGQVYVVRSVYDNSVTVSANNTYLRITQYDGVTGAVVDEAWSQAPAPDPGTRRTWSTNPVAFHDPSLRQLAVATFESEQQTGSPFHYSINLRLSTYSLAPDYPISQQLRSTSSAFI